MAKNDIRGQNRGSGIIFINWYWVTAFYEI
jgi:hypothetical protein